MITPSLAMIPQAYKSGKVYSQLPVSGSGDLDFTRASAATRINKDGFIEEVGANVPRLDYSNGGCPSLLLEPTRLQKIQYSEDFTSSWGSGSSTITSNQGISPNGTLNADLVSSVSVNGNVSTSHTVLNDSLITTQSIFVKYISGTSNFMLRGAFVGGTATAKASKFNLATASVISTDTSASIEYYGNGWYRVSQQIANNSSGNTTLVYQNFTTNDATSTNQLLLWGAQTEVGSYPTSYIPNYGTSAGVTRSAETANGAGDASTFNNSEGVLYAEISSENDSTNKQISINDGSSSNRISIILNAATNGVVASTNVGGSDTNLYVLTTNNVALFNKFAYKYKANDFSFWINGVEQTAIISGGSVPLVNLSQLDFNIGSGANPFRGNVKDVRVYNTALTDAELQALTTL